VKRTYPGGVPVKIPVFVSCPTALSPAQDAARSVITRLLDELNLDPRALGRSDYPTELPLREVLAIARHCAGGLVLGFEQFHATAGTWKRGVGAERGERALSPNDAVSFPTPWNHLEAGILFGLGLPMLMFRESTVSGGVFDTGVTDAYIHKLPDARTASGDTGSLKEVFLKWHARVSAHYYST
jgi:hypothetical protein